MLKYRKYHGCNGNMRLCVVRDPIRGIDFGHVSKMLPYLSVMVDVTIYDRISYRDVKKINNSFDIVNVQYPANKIFRNSILNHLYFLFLFRRLKIKKTITMHGFVTKESNRYLSIFAPVYYRLLFKHTKVIVLSELQKKILNQYHIKNVVVIPHGCNDCNYNTKKEKGVIFFHGFIRKSKGIEILIKAVKKLLSEGYNVYLKIFGSSYTGEESYIESIKNLLEKEIYKHYELNIDIHSEDDIAREASKSYIVVLPYTDRNIEVSGVLHTIMACGTPVIASNTPRFTSELKSDIDACIVEPNENAIAEGIKKLLVDKEYWKMLSVNIQKKSEDYRWERITQMLIYELKNM